MLLVTGAAVFLVTLPGATALRTAVIALIVFVLGVGLVFGPWLLRLSQDLAEERRARVRSQERAEIAAHVHDSVLHTLALVRRSANDPRQVVSLARRQERELRTWLGGGPPVSSNSLAVILDDVAATVETDFGVPIEIVKVGDCPVDSSVEALVTATREAMVNAAKHSGAPSIAVYMEVERDRVTVFVRDRGVGFAAARWRRDRHGVPDSIIGRMHRHGGRPRCGAGRARAPRSSSAMPRSGADERRPSRACSWWTTITCSSPESGRRSVTTSRWSESASDVDSAVELIRERQPDVVLVDVHMPDGGGAEVIRRVLRDAPRRALPRAVGVRRGRRRRSR